MHRLTGLHVEGGDGGKGGGGGGCSGVKGRSVWRRRWRVHGVVYGEHGECGCMRRRGIKGGY